MMNDDLTADYHAARKLLKMLRIAWLQAQELGSLGIPLSQHRPLTLDAIDLSTK